MSENNNLYVNVTELLELIDCMLVSTSDRKEQRIYEEIISIILDLKWKEIKN